MKVDVLGLIYGGHAAHTKTAENAVFAANDTAFIPEIYVGKGSTVLKTNGGTCRIPRLTDGAVSHVGAKERRADLKRDRRTLKRPEVLQKGYLFVGKIAAIFDKVILKVNV